MKRSLKDYHDQKKKKLKILSSEYFRKISIIFIISEMRMVREAFIGRITIFSIVVSNTDILNF